MDDLEKRYEVQTEWRSCGNGRLARAKDLKLNREVLLCRLPEANEARLREALNRLRHAARFSDKRFLHLLDGYTADRELYGVLTDDKGVLLTEHWSSQYWSGSEILEHIRDLAAGVREGRKERLVRFSVSADNIWIDGNGKLRFINYWTEAEADCSRDIHGLGYLIYQLCARTVKKPSSMTAYCEMLRYILTDLPGGSAEDAVQWACSAFHPSCTLKEFEGGLNRLLTPRPEEEAVVQAAEKPRMMSGLRLRPVHMISVIVIFACIGFIWAWTSSGGSAAHKGSKELPAAATAKGVAAGASEQPEKDAPSGTEASPNKADGAASPGRSQSTTADDISQAEQAAAPAESGKVPNLVGLNRQAAEKQALQAGLKYQFFLEADSRVQGTVIKQDLNPGDTVSPGSQITFWVSKGR